MSTLSNYDDDFLQCRGMDLHEWHRTGDDHTLMRAWPSSRTVYRVAHRCKRCTAFKVRAINRLTGDILGSQYRHPWGYRAEAADRPKHFRAEQIKREIRGRKAAATQRGRQAS